MCERAYFPTPFPTLAIIKHFNLLIWGNLIPHLYNFWPSRWQKCGEHPFLTALFHLYSTLRMYFLNLFLTDGDLA